MNSEKLKNKFNSEYSIFFRENSKVFSLPLVMNWASDINEEYRGVHIKQKIPLRIYLGVNKIKEKKIKFNQINYFDINENIFVKEDLVQHGPLIYELYQKLNEYFKEQNNLDHGLEFNVLAETGKGQGMGFMSILTALFIIGYKNSYDENYKNFKLIEKNEKIMDYLNKDTFYDDLLKTSLNLNKVIGREISIVSQTTSLFNGNYPIVSFVQKNYKEIKPEEIKLFGYKLNHLSEDLPKYPYIPIDYGLIYTGMPVSISQILYSNKHTKNKKNFVLENMVDFFGKDIEQLSDENKPYFCDNFLNKKSCKEKSNAFLKTYLELMSILSLKSLNNIVNIYKEPYNEKLSEKFLENIKKITRFNLLTKKCSTHFKKFIYDVISNFENSHIDIAIAPNDTMLMGGNAIFAMKFEGNRGKLLNTIEKVNENKNGIKLVYSNWLDGIEKEGIILEQDIENNIFSNYVSNNSLILIDNNGKKRIIESNYLDNNETNEGLFLDLTKNKIFLNGNKLTSKEIKSQNTTIEILLKLLENKGNFISNKDLSLSSYSTNKNDMTSKIISPLQKLIKKENNIDFKITINGTISNFKLKLEENILNINIVKYVGSKK